MEIKFFMFRGIKNLFKDKNKLVLIGILLVAIFFRFFLLDSIPPGLYPDVAVNGMDAVRANETGDYRIFYPANNGREGLFMNLVAFSFKILGTGLWQLRFVGAVIGVLTVLGTYLLGKEIFSKNIGLISAFFMATSFWAVNFSRIGFRAIMVPLVLVWGSFFLFKAFNTEKEKISSKQHKSSDTKISYFSVFTNKTDIRNSFYYLLSAFIFGLGFYTYIAYKAAILIFAAVFGYKVFVEKDFIRQNWLKMAMFFIVLILTAFPLFYYQQTHKNEVSRTGQVSVFNPDVNKGNLIKTLAITTAKGLGMYNFYGDPNARHNYKSLPALNPLAGIAFLIGIFISVKKILKDLKNRNKEFFVFCFLFLGFFVMLLPSILTEEGMPHSLRAIGTMPFAFLFAGIGAEKGQSFFKKRGLFFLIPIILAFVIFFDFVLYFWLWAKDPETRGQFNENYLEASRYLNTLSPSVNKYVILNVGGVEVDGLPVAAQTFKFITYRKSNVEFLTKEKIHEVNFKNNSFIVLARNDEMLIEDLKAMCPEGESYIYNSGEPIEFSVFKVPQSASSCR